MACDQEALVVGAARPQRCGHASRMIDSTALAAVERHDPRDSTPLAVALQRVRAVAHERLEAEAFPQGDRDGAGEKRRDLGGMEHERDGERLLEREAEAGKHE